MVLWPDNQILLLYTYFFSYRRCNMSVRISCYLNFILSFFCELRSFACNPFASFCDIQNVYHMRESISSVNSSFRDNKRKNPNIILLIIATRLVVILKFLYEKECGAALSMCRWKCLFCDGKEIRAFNFTIYWANGFVHEMYECVLLSLACILALSHELQFINKFSHEPFRFVFVVFV